MAKVNSAMQILTSRHWRKQELDTTTPHWFSDGGNVASVYGGKVTELILVEKDGKEWVKLKCKTDNIYYYYDVEAARMGKIVKIDCPQITYTITAIPDKPLTLEQLKDLGILVRYHEDDASATN